MTSEPTGQDAPVTDGGGIAHFATSKRIKQLVIALVAVLVLVTVYFLWRGVADDKADTRWDEYFALRKENEPEQDPLWSDPYGVYGAQRDRYARALENFLDEQVADGATGTLVPQVRWRIARLLADHLLSMRDVLDLEKRTPYYDRALAHLATIRDEHPDFPLNWEMFSDREFPNLTRKLIAWFEHNKAWEAEYLPQAKAPDGEQTVVFRTTRGDLRFKLYASDAPNWTKNFVARCVSGFYDGTSLVERREVGDDLSPRESGVRGGSAASRGLPAYQWRPLVPAIETPTGGGLLGEESRNLIPFTRGIVAAWHDPATAYDDAQEILFVSDRSPQLDYDFTPIGKLSDDASLATLDRIFDGRIWRDDPAVSVEEDARPALDGFQVPVVIVKALVYGANGALLTPAEGESLSFKAEADASETQLGTLVNDAYLTEAPPAPGANKAPDDDGDDGDDPDDGGDPDDDENDGD